MDYAIFCIVSHGFAICVIAFVVIFVSERIFPKYAYENKKNIKRTITNMVVAVSYRFVAAPIIIIPLMVYVTRDLPYRMHRPIWYAGWLAFFIDILLLDFLNYSIHISAHKIPILWRFHTLHHLDEHIDSTTGFRQHFGEKFLVLIIRLPGMFSIGVPFATIVAFEVISFCITTFHHSNINIPKRLESVLGKLFVMPSFHNIHHGRERKYTDTNYGFIFSIWDKLFRTQFVGDRPHCFSNGLDHHEDLSAVKLLYFPFTMLPVSKWK